MTERRVEPTTPLDGLHESELKTTNSNYSNLIEMGHPGDDALFSLSLPIIRELASVGDITAGGLGLVFALSFLAGMPAVPFRAGSLMAKESLVQSMALQSVGQDLRPALKIVVPQLIQSLPEMPKARAIVNAVLFGRDFDFVKDIDPVVAFKAIASKIPQMPDLGIPSFVSKTNQSRRWLLSSFSLEVPEAIRRLYGMTQGRFAPLMNLTRGTYASGQRFVQVSYEAVDLPPYTGATIPELQPSFPGPLLKIQMTPLQDMLKDPLNPYGILSCDKVYASVGLHNLPGIIWQPTQPKDGSRPKRFTKWGGLHPLNNGMWWPRPEFRAATYKRGCVIRTSKMEGPLDDVWLGLGPEEMHALCQPVNVGPLDQLSQLDQLTVLGRLMFKVVEAQEALLGLTDAGRERLKDSDVNSIPAIADGSAILVRQVVNDLAKIGNVLEFGETNSRWRKMTGQSKKTVDPARVAEGAKQFCCAQMVAAGMNPGRFWRYFTGLTYQNLTPALSHLNRQDIEKVTIGLLDSSMVNANIIGAGSFDTRTRPFNGSNDTELAYDVALMDFTHRPDEVPDFTRDHFEFGWFKLARLLRPLVDPSIAAIEDDIEFLVRVFDVAPELDWA